MPAIDRPPQSRQTETASSRSALPRFSLSGSPEEMSASKSRPIEKAMPMPAASSSLVVTAGSIEDGSSDGASMKS